MNTITFIIATIGRESLAATLQSIETWPGDEILMVSQKLRVADPRVRYIDCRRGRNWGHTERNLAMPHATGAYLAHIDDDDVYAPGARALMADAITTTPGRPVLFRMRYPDGHTLWDTPEVRCGNVGTPMALLPNEPAKLGQFGPRMGGDCQFLQTMRWDPSTIVWRDDVIALIGRRR